MKSSFTTSWRLVSMVAITAVLASSTFAQKNASKSLAENFRVSENGLSVNHNTGEFKPNPVEDNGMQNSTNRPDVVGTMSVENFQGTQGNLSFTHDSADGYRNYLANWYQPNFARQDAGVSVWLYNDVIGGDNFDIWNSGGTDYGVDAVLTAFHSGHGGMSSNTFFVPMGADWAGRGWNAFSTNMRLGGNQFGFGDERLRYLFWDTCNSIMISGGNNPYTTWGARARGIRMIFGYETVSVDNPNYGKFFWEEWNKGKSLTYSQLDASWRINTGQSPMVMAFGATQAEAISRRDNERFLEWGSASNSWGAWRWYNASSLVADRLAMPSEIKSFRSSNGGSKIETIAAKIGLDFADQSAIQKREFGIKAVETSDMSLIVEANGNFELMSKNTAAKNSEFSISDEALIAQAEQLVRESDLMNGYEYRVGMIRDLNEAAGSETEQVAPSVAEKTVVFDQVMDGLAFNDPENGHLEISFNRDGAVTRVRSSVKNVGEVINQLSSGSALSVENARNQALRKFDSAVGSFEIVKDSESIGYQLFDGAYRPVYRAIVANTNDKLARPAEVIVPLM